MIRYRVTGHARENYMIRTCRSFLEAVEDLPRGIENSDKVTYDEAKTIGFKVIKNIKGNTYHTWTDLKTGEPLLAIIRGKLVVTVQTKEMYSWAIRKKKIRGVEGAKYRGMDFRKDIKTIRPCHKRFI